MVMQRLDVQSPAISADRFLELIAQPEYKERNIELVEGKIVEMPHANAEHAEILSVLHYAIAHFVYKNSLGRLGVGDAGFILARNPDRRDTVRGVDLAFISKAKSPAPWPRTRLEIAPDLAVEVLSPSNTAMDINLKIGQILQAGTASVWIVDPQSRTVTVHTSDGAVTLREGDTLTGGDVLPGFELPVADIFPA